MDPSLEAVLLVVVGYLLRFVGEAVTASRNRAEMDRRERLRFRSDMQREALPALQESLMQLMEGVSTKYLVAKRLREQGQAWNPHPPDAGDQWTELIRKGQQGTTIQSVRIDDEAIRRDVDQLKTLAVELNDSSSLEDAQEQIQEMHRLFDVVNGRIGNGMRELY